VCFHVLKKRTRWGKGMDNAETRMEMRFIRMQIGQGTLLVGWILQITLRADHPKHTNDFQRQTKNGCCVLVDGADKRKPHSFHKVINERKQTATQRMRCIYAN